MPPKKIAAIDLTRASNAALEPRMLLNPRAMLRKKMSSPEKEVDEVSAIERLHKVQARTAQVPKKRAREDTNGDDSRKSTFNRGSGVVGHDLQEASARQAKLKKTSATPIIDITDDKDSSEDDIHIIPADRKDEVCFGMLKATVNAFAIPEAPSLLPTRWPAIECNVQRGQGNILHIRRKEKAFGVVSSETAAPLSRLLSLDLVRCTCRVPSRPRYASEEQSKTNVSVILPLEIIIYGDQTNKDRISIILSQKNCFLIQPTNYDQSFVYVNPHIRSQSYKPGTGTRYGISGVKTAEEIKSEIETLFNEIQTSSTLAEHETPSILKTPLLRHQRQALTFCLDHESDGDQHSLWKNSTAGSGKKMWKNKITPQILYRAPSPSSGGLLFDEMGLGKTLCILALLCATMAEAGSFEDHDVKVKATLVVCPLSVLTGWLDQAAAHIEASNVKVLVHHDKTRVYEIPEIRQYDLILTTYATVASEFKHKDDPSRPTVLPKLDFFRVVLDEAHTIKEASTLANQATVALNGKHRWCITATPVQNSLNDLAALFTFLKVEPFDNRAIWNQYISQPMKSGDPIAVTRLRTLLKLRVLRRTKDQGEQNEKLLSLPKRTEELRLLTLSPEEQDLYNTYLVQYQRQSKTSSTMHVLQNINQLRQICISTALLPRSKDVSDDDKGDKSSADEDIRDMIDGAVCALCESIIDQDNDDDDDGDNSDKSDTRLLYTPKCLHFFCDEHGLRASPGSDVPCPAPGCHGRGPMKLMPAVVQTKSAPARRKVSPKNAPYSTKIKALLTDLCAIADDEDEDDREKLEDDNEKEVDGAVESYSGQDEGGVRGPIKSVVFSQFTSFLDLIGYALTDLDIPFARLDGTMSRDERTVQLEHFRTSSTTRIILVSTRAGGVGLNLTAASRVFLMEPSWTPSVEAQAMERVHRIGQVRPVYYTRYIIEGSIESTMLKLQNQKTTLANMSLSSKVGDDSIKKSLLDLRKLL